MGTLVIAGTETVTGTHLLRTFRALNDEPVIGLPTRETPEGEFDRVVYCGPAAETCWDAHRHGFDLSHAEANVRRWATFATEHDADFVYLSSDAIFTGPRLFHSEDSENFCQSPQANTYRRWEEVICSLCEHALVLRTHVLGIAGDGTSWVERIRNGLENGHLPPIDSLRHASPIAATHLVEVINRACDEGLTGHWHVGCSERISPTRLTRLLATELELTVPFTLHSESADARPLGFGRGETALNTLEIRRELCLAMPTAAETASALAEELAEVRHTPSAIAA